MDEQTSKQALAAAKNVSPFTGVDVAGYSDVQVDHDLLGQLAGKLAGETATPAAPQPAELPAPPKPVGIHVSNDAMWVYLHIEGKRPYGLTVLNARELALALRQACNRVERGQQ